MLETKHIKTDLCVVGGGLAGMCAAISAARQGISVVLMHERAVLGGNASSEIRMWVCGAKGENNRETGIIEEILLENLYRNPTKSYAVWDTVLYDFVKREKNITLLLNCACMDAKAETGEFENGRDTRIKSVKGYQLTTQSFIEVEAKYYADCSGDSILAPLTNAEFRIGREAASEFSEDTDREVADSMTMGMSCMIQGRETNNKVDYIAPDWATKITDEQMEGKKLDIYNDGENFWYLELGGDRDTIADSETLRDELVALAAGMWDYVKKNNNADNWDLDFFGFLPGKRESRRMCGEYIITGNDILSGHVFDDEIAYGGWPVDDHFPGGFYHKGKTNKIIHTPAPYSLPYRALYSKNVENLFFAGRNISMTHFAMSSVRVMATCALLGQAVGVAAAIATKNALTPHGVYLEKIKELQNTLLINDCFLPSKTRQVSDACKNATLIGASDSVRNGIDREHAIYGEQTVDKTDGIKYTFDKTFVKNVHITFDSDLERTTLPGSECERYHSMRCNTRLDSPQMCMPKTLCKEFELYADGERVLAVTNNRNRAYDINIDKDVSSLELRLISNWGDTKTTPVISFDW